MLYIEAASSREELAKIAGSFQVPLLVDLIESSMVPALSRDELGELGFSIIIRPLSALFLVHKMLGEFYTSLRREGTTKGWVRQMTSLEDFNAFIGLGDFMTLESNYKTSDTS